MKKHLLSVDNLTIGFPDVDNTITHVVRDVSLQIESGSRIGVVGESGCGKSTLAYALLGMIRGTGVHVHGTVAYAGEQIFAMTPTQLQRIRGAEIALVPQNAGQSLAPHRTVYQQIAEVLEIHQHIKGDAAWQRVVQLLADMRLRNPAQLARRYPHQLSGGQQQRVALAMALAGEPKVLVLDEPTTGLDVTTQAQLLALLHELMTNTDMAIVLVSHDLGVIAQMCHQVAVMYAGEVVEMGETAHIFQQPYHPYTRGLIAAMPQLTSQTLPYAMPGQVRHSATGQQCTFLDRCGFAQPGCAIAPRLTMATPTRTVRCHHWQTVSVHKDAVSEFTQELQRTPVSDELPLLEMRHVSATYQQPSWWWWERNPVSMVVTQVNIAIPPGQTCAVVGESGSGKSTLARVITGLHQPVAGGIYLDNVQLHTTVAQRSHNERRRIQLIFQNPDLSLNPRHTVAEILYRPQAVFFGRTRSEAHPYTISMLQQMRLDESYLARLPRQLSGGEKQRVAIARAFLADPDVVVCDEVVSALDVSVQAVLIQLLVDIQQQRGTAYLFIAHDLAVVRAVAHTVVVLFAGHVCEQGATTDVFTAPYHPYTMVLLNAVLTVPRRDIIPLVSQISDETTMIYGGCSFRHRCPIAIPQQCADVAPPWQQIAESHAYRCHHPPEVLALHRKQRLLPIQ